MHVRPTTAGPSGTTRYRVPVLSDRPASSEDGSGRGVLLSSWSGGVWVLAIAASYFFISSPLVFEPDFDTSLRRAIWCTTIACVLTLPALRLPRAPWAALPFLGFASASVLWSTNPDNTIHFLGLYVVLSLLAVVTASNVSTRVLGLGVMAGAAVVIATSVYAYGRHLPGADVAPGSSGYLAGVGTNRNILAYTMILAFPFVAAHVPRGRLQRACWALAALVILSGILLAESATGIAAVCVISAVGLVIGSRDHLIATGRVPGRRYWGVVGGLMAVLTGLGVAWYELAHRDLSRDFSLTGRVRIWDAVWTSTRPSARWVGDGWGSVWPHPWRLASPNSEFDAIIRTLGYFVTHGHNSVMDLVPEVGLVGVGLFSLIYVVPVVRALRARRAGSPVDRESGRVTVLGVIALVLAGVTEPISTIPLGFYMAMLLVTHDVRATPRPPSTTEAAPRPGRARAPRRGRRGRAAPRRRRGPSGDGSSASAPRRRRASRAASRPDAGR